MVLSDFGSESGKIMLDREMGDDDANLSSLVADFETPPIK